MVRAAPYPPPGYGPPAYPALGYAAPGYGPPGYAAAPYAAPAYPIPMGYVPPPPGYAPVGFAPYQPQTAALLARNCVGRRWLAALLDLGLVFGLWVGLLSLFNAVSFGYVEGWLYLGFTVALGFAYYILPDASGSATPGKLALGLRLVDKNLQPAGPGQVAARSCELFVWVILFGLLFFLVQLYYTYKNGQGLGDSLVGTFVVPKKDVLMSGLNYT